MLSLLLPRQNRLRSEIEDALGVDLLKQEAEHGALNVPHLSKYILNTMTLLCAPVRDEAVQKLESVTDPVHLLRCGTWLLSPEMALSPPARKSPCLGQLFPVEDLTDSPWLLSGLLAFFFQRWPCRASGYP